MNPNSIEAFRQRLHDIVWKVEKDHVDTQLILSFYQAYMLMVKRNLDLGIIKRVPLSESKLGPVAWESLVHLFTSQNNQFDMAKSLLTYNTAWLFGHHSNNSELVFYVGTHRIQGLLLLAHLGIISDKTQILSLDVDETNAIFEWYYDSRLDTILEDPHICYDYPVVVNDILYYIQKQRNRREAIGYYTTLFEDKLTNNPKLFESLYQFDPIIQFQLTMDKATGLKVIDQSLAEVIQQHTIIPEYSIKEKEILYKHFIDWTEQKQCVVWKDFDAVRVIEALNNTKYNNGRYQIWNTLPLPLLAQINGDVVVVYEYDAMWIKEKQQDHNYRKTMVGVFVGNQEQEILVPEKIALSGLLNNYIGLKPFWNNTVMVDNIKYIKLPSHFDLLYLKTMKEIIIGDEQFVMNFCKNKT